MKRCVGNAAQTESSYMFSTLTNYLAAHLRDSARLPRRRERRHESGSMRSSGARIDSGRVSHGGERRSFAAWRSRRRCSGLISCLSMADFTGVLLTKGSNSAVRASSSEETTVNRKAGAAVGEHLRRAPAGSGQRSASSSEFLLISRRASSIRAEAQGLALRSSEAESARLRRSRAAKTNPGVSWNRLSRQIWV